MSTDQKIRDVSAESPPFGANAVRLSPRVWLLTIVLCLVLATAIPRLWQRLEPLETRADYRLPYALSEDYWLYKTYAQAAMKDENAIPIIGDSVVWGQYARPGETLSHALNAELGASRFANLGVNGIHPIALSGLITHYGGAVSGRKVIMHYNPLWMMSARRDLQTTKPTRFNHPRLVPQFFPKIPSYEETVANRLSIAVNNRVPLFQWSRHLRIVYFNNNDLPNWTVEHPYANPVSAVTLVLPEPEDVAPSDPTPWNEKSDRLLTASWISPGDSLQWAFFKTSLATLKARGNEVFVLFGPFNQHILTEENRTFYQGMQEEMVGWLDENGYDYFAPEPLPSEVYADASHPIREGYEILAAHLMGEESFQLFIDR